MGGPRVTVVIEDLVRDPSRQFPSLPNPEMVTALRVWFCKYRTLVQIADLTNLRTLVIAGYPDRDFGPLAHLRNLQYISVLDFGSVNDLTPLSELQDLRTLRLHSPPSWDSSGKVIEVPSLASIARLPRLQHLELFGVRPPDKSLADLEGASALQTVRVSKYPKAEVARYESTTGVHNPFAPSPPIPDWN
jgi:hypothetical protein